MAITHTGSGYAFANTITIPTHAAGDLIVICAERLNNTAASLPAGWNDIQSGGANTLSLRAGWKLAASSSETSGTWTNARSLIVMVFSGTHQTTPIGGSAMTNGTSATSIPFPTVTMTTADGTSWVGGFGRITSADADFVNPPTGMTKRRTDNDSLPSFVAHDTNGGVSSWSSTSVGSISSTTYRTITFEIQAPATGGHPIMRRRGGVPHMQTGTLIFGRSW